MLKKNIEEKLSQKNTRPTSMRVLVYDVLASSNKALSLAEIESAFEMADRTTIYRTLKTFEEKGIVHSIQENSTSKYVLCADDCKEDTHSDWHLHFYCKLCKETTCKTDVLIPHSISKQLRVDEIRFFAKGICEKCLADL